MSDHGRLDISSKIKAKLQPDSTKSYGKQAGHEIRGKADQVMSGVQPQREKSTIQKISDKLTPGNKGRRVV